MKLRGAATVFVLFLSAMLTTSAAGQRTATGRSIMIVAEPKAAVWIDGVSYGRTNEEGRLEIRGLSPGAKTLRLRADGFKEKSQPLAATARGDVKVSMTATTDPGELKFQEAEKLAFADREKAAAAYEEAIRLRPAYAPAYIALARVEIERNEFESAQNALRRLKKISPRNAEGSAVEGRLYAQSGDDAKAIAAFKRAITEARGFQPEAYTGLGLLYREMADAAEYGSPEQAAHYAESTKNLRLALKQLGTAPDAVVIYQFLGRNLENQKKYAEAIAIYEEFLRLFPDTPEATSVQSFIVQLQKQMNGEPE
jgi:tetratricopeptide (TPR) repeat protein